MLRYFFIEFLFLSLHFSVQRVIGKGYSGKKTMKNKLLYMKFRFWIAGEINSLDCNWFITTPSYPKMKYHVWYHLCPIGHNIIVITARLGSIMENETPANVLKHPLPAKELSGCCNCVYPLPCLYFITLDLWDAIKKWQNFGNSYQWMLCLERPSSCILGTNHLCLPSFTYSLWHTLKALTNGRGRESK